MENEQSELSISETEAESKNMSTCLLDMEENAAAIETKKGLLYSSSAKLIESASWIGVDSTSTRDCFIETMFPVYLGSTLPVEKAVVVYCSIKVLELVALTFKHYKHLPKRADDVKKLGVRQKIKLFAPGSSFHFCPQTRITRPLFKTLIWDCKRLWNTWRVKTYGRS